MHAKQNNITAIVGLGKTGLACARFLTAKKQKIVVTDTRNDPPGLAELKNLLPDATIALGGIDSDLLDQADEIIVSPGLSINEAPIKNYSEKGKSVIGDIELFARYAKAPICAITGSNAKSTVTSLVAEMGLAAGLDVRLGGNIGTPAVELLSAQEPYCYVLELSSFQLETTYSLKPKAATILNISADHMDRYKNLQEYIAAKQRIYCNAENIITNRHDVHTQPKALNGSKNVSFGFSEPLKNEYGLAAVNNEIYLAYGNKPLLPVSDLHIKGQHNWINALAALALADAMQFPISSSLKALQEFTGLAHRCQWVAEKNSISWYNDSKGTNVGATLAAISGLGSSIKGKIILLAGGLGKNADFTQLLPAIKNYVRAVVLMGEDAPKIARVLPSSMEKVLVTSMEKAVQTASELAQAKDAVLLSPACASFDMFKNFEHRGDIFMKAVKELLQ